MADLKSCPFCGGEAEIVENDCFVNVSCKNLKCRGWASCLEYKTKKEAIEAWDRRTESEELKFTRGFIHEHGLEFALASAWKRRAEDGK